MRLLSLYIHIPWCIKKCPYCDFNSHAIKSEAPEQAYIDALLKDLQQDLSLCDTAITISSIFIGGGTPSLFSANAFDKLFTGISELVALQDRLEITLEANPGTFESNKFAAYRAIGINRLSIGIQSFNNQHLQRLGRVHSAEEALTAIQIAHQTGFDNLNLDLMFGLPNQTNSQMLNDVKTAINMQPSHISFYQLSLEPNTYFHKYPPKLPEDEKIFLGQQQCQQLLAESGYGQYEISAYSKHNATCQHNLNYWQFGDYLGIGAGAHGKLSLSKPEKILRTMKPKNPEQYLNHEKSMITEIKEDELPLEFLMNQLRIKSGFNLDHYQLVTGLNGTTLQPALTECVNKGLLIQQNQQFYCSEKGWNFIDDILESFIPFS
ncbi:MAG: radical SAM family heme chaperone HemW [Methylococcales symbiont of Hymedesmia sp. n. MRB-2018]|nr:MAG: radical SAM family heme chaperone HemW [Methylococcales symbiont of Hymedesmia sp. n. MRB-2018]